jgi:DNA replication protein
VAKFVGFPAGKVHLTPIPATFFTDLLPQIDDLGELRITLYALWLLDQQEGPVRYFCLSDCMENVKLAASFGRTEEDARRAVETALEKAVQRGTLVVSDPLPSRAVYFLNSPRGRAALEALSKGEWSLDDQNRANVALEASRPNIFALYEENIGPLTPMIVETLREAEQEYPQAWIEEAVRAAVENNVRRWRYVEAILRARKEKTYAPNRGNDEEDRRRYARTGLNDEVDT